jgi:YidC/Oxa1 family membrane protein insertase
MEENKLDGRVFLSIFLMIGFFFVWNHFFPMTPPQKKSPTTQEVIPTNTVSPTIAASSSLAPEETFPIRGTTFDAVISSHGGVIKSWKILDQQYATPEGPLDLIATVPENVQKPWPGQVTFDTASFPVPVGIFAFTKASEPNDAPNSLRLRWNSSDNSIILDKYFTINQDQDGLELQLTLTNKGAQDASARLALRAAGYQDPAKMKGEGFWIFRAPADVSAPACYVNNTLKHSVFSKNTYSETHGGKVHWVGVNRTYYLKTFFPMNEADQGLTCTISTKENGEMVSTLLYSQEIIAAGASVTHQLGIYMGPKKTEHIANKMASETQSAYLEGATDYGAWFGWMVEPLARGMLWTLIFFHDYVGNWGLAIILLTIAVRILTFWPSQKSFKSMQGMAALKPELDKLREKYKDDQAAFAQAQFALMKSKDVSMLSGCLPMLLQLPFFWGLYTMIYNAVEIYRAPFGLWIKDLSVADPYFILPLLTGAILWVNQRMTPTTMDPAQAKMMNWMMPGMMTLFMLFLPAGLVIYTITSMGFGIIQQYYLKRAYPAPTPAAGDDSPLPPATAIKVSAPQPRNKNKRR